MWYGPSVTSGLNTHVAEVPALRWVEPERVVAPDPQAACRKPMPNPPRTRSASRRRTARDRMSLSRAVIAVIAEATLDPECKRDKANAAAVGGSTRDLFDRSYAVHSVDLTGSPIV